MTHSVTVFESEFVCLWKSRVQYLRPFYEYSDKKPRQTGWHWPSHHVWFVPAVLTAWLAVFSCIFLTALRVEGALDTGENKTILESSGMCDHHRCVGLRLMIITLF